MSWFSFADHSKRLILLWLALISGAASGKITPEQAKTLPAPANRMIQFSQDIKPIIEASCIKCHGRGKSKGGFRLDTRETLLKGGENGPVVVIGKSEESYLVELTAAVDPNNFMPKKGSRLTSAQIGVLRAWIDQGLPWDGEVTFGKLEPANLKPRRPVLPPAAAGLNNPIDQFLVPYFQNHQFRPPPPVDDRRFARRVYLDVIGLLPTPEEFAEFVQDSRTDKRRRLVARLLEDDQRYAEHWLTFWNDLLRNDYRGTGYIDGGRRQITGWLFGALLKNMPYDRFVSELINPHPGSEGFAKGIVWRGVVNASQTPQMQAAQNISQIFMGVNLKCASCHDSFINDWTLADAYGLASVYADQPLELFRCDKPTGEASAVRFIYPELGDISASASKAERTKRLAEIMTGSQNGRLSRTIVNRLWARFLGRGLVEPVDDMEQAAWHSDLLDWLASDLVNQGYNLKKTMEHILTSRAYQLPAVNLGDQIRKDFVFNGPAVRRMSAEQFRDSLSLITTVAPVFPAANVNFWEAATPEEQAKLWTAHAPARSQWIWAFPEARIDAEPQTVYFRREVNLEETPTEASIVAAADNQYALFINGAQVATGKDFTNPNLVDLRPHLKKGKNVIGVAATNDPYPGQKSGSSSEERGISPSNPAGLLLYARIRHQAARGSSSPPVIMDISTDHSWRWSTSKYAAWSSLEFDPQGWGEAAELGGHDSSPWNLAGPWTSTLSIAAQYGKVRSSLMFADPLLVALGRPNREQVVTSRASQATTLQGLELTNGETLAKLLKQGAERLIARSGGAGGELIEQIYLTAISRKPTPLERQEALAAVGQPPRPEGVEDLLWAVAMLPEFQLIY